ncbi:protein-disulfide reductase DsbD family protein [bacterium]|nr:protein-disulfide reductase DsbD family protein [bacterium]
MFTCKVRGKIAVAESLAVSVDLQVCDEQVCLPPTQRKVDVKQ